MTPRQVRAARCMLDWSRERLAKESGYSIHTIDALSNKDALVSDAARADVEEAFRRAGVTMSIGPNGEETVSYVEP